MYHHVLVPISLDEDSSIATVLKAARGLAYESGTITLLHVMGRIPDYAKGYLPDGFQGLTQSQIEASLNEFADQSPLVRGVVECGKPATVVMEYAEQNDVDCVLLSAGDVGEGPGRRRDILSATLRHARCAVHVLK